MHPTQPEAKLVARAAAAETKASQPLAKQLEAAIHGERADLSLANVSSH